MGRAVDRLAARAGLRGLGPCEALHRLAPRFGGRAGLEAAVRRELDNDSAAAAAE